jgi:hypothetical protein
LRKLQGIGEKDRTEPEPQARRRIQKLKSELADVPNWNRVPPYMERTNKVLEELSRHLVADPDDPKPVESVVARATRSVRRRSEG